MNPNLGVNTSVNTNSTDTIVASIEMNKINKIDLEKIYKKVLKYLTKYFEHNQFSHNVRIIDGTEHHCILSIKNKILIEIDDDSHFKGDPNILKKDILNIEEAVDLDYKVIRICLSDILLKKINLKRVILHILSKIDSNESFNIYYISINKHLYKHHSFNLKYKFISILLY
jgi:hypothetical protein